MPEKKNIALFMGILENEYSSSVMKGALKGAKECDVNLIIFQMDLIEAVYSEPVLNAYRYQYNILSAYMNNNSIDGIIIEYGTITSFLNQERKKEFLSSLNKPTVLIAEKAEGFASICMDNASGLEELMDHLVVDHGCRKIAYLSGPENNFDAEIRLNVYKRALGKHNIDIEPELIAYGNFSEYVDAQANELIDKNPEAIVCANDSMALCVVKLMKERGLTPGKDIKVTGFDNLPAGFLLDPSLTSVKADPIELSCKAVHDLCKDNFKICDLTINTKMVRRQTCGCCDVELNETIKEMIGISSDWREMANYQMRENAIRHGLERELGNVVRELVFKLDTTYKRYEGILAMMRRFKFQSFGLFLYDEFIEHRVGDVWKNPEFVNLVGYYHDLLKDTDHIMEKGELVVPITEMFNWGLMKNGCRHDVFILPLFFGEMQIGLVTVEADPERYLYAYDIAGQISNILYTVAMNEEQEKMKEALEYANKSKSHFLANMSHEIRTPINAIIGFNEMILRENKDEVVADYAKDVRNAANALLLLVNDTLDFSKIEAGKMEIIVSEYKLYDLLKSVIGMMTSRAEKAGLKLIFEYDDQLPCELEGDSGRIQQILINLLSNAIKYTEKGQVTLNVSGEVSGDRVFLCVKIKDTGIGIKEEDISKLFNIFERIEEKRNRNIEGTGLGINIVSGLLKLMNSELKVSSVYGEGSEFSFEIEQKIIDTKTIKDSLAVATKEDRRAYTSAFRAPGAKLLVVDDNFLNRKVIASLLKDTQIQVEQAESGRACIEMSRNNEYDIILLDHMMPEMDGIETLSILLEEGIVDVDSTPIIALTANAISGAKEEYLKFGFTDYLAKPVLPKVLYELIMRYIKDDKIIIDE